MAEGKKRMRSAMDALDDVKDKMPEDAYLMLCEASKEKYARLTREKEGDDEQEAEDEHDEEEEDEEEEEGQYSAYSIVAGHATVPEGVTEIGEEAFRECSSLTSVTIPSSVTLAPGAFDSSTIVQI